MAFVLIKISFDFGPDTLTTFKHLELLLVVDYSKSTSLLHKRMLIIG